MASSSWANVATSCGSSRALDESLVATATGAWSWVALEVPAAWGRKALPESDLPAEVKERLTAVGNELPGGRVIFIKRNDRPDPPALRLYLARSEEDGGQLYQVELGRYDELLELDLAAILEGRTAGTRAKRLESSLFLVCTNGKRDLCCARYGIAAYNALSQIAPEQVWRSSHQGGHRFAANLIVLPAGLHYGRIDEASAAALYESHSANRIRLDHFRGRTCYPGHVQAAEHALREQHADLSIPAIHLVRSEELGEGQWTVELTAEILAEPAPFHVQAEQSDYRVILTSGTDKEETVTRYRVREAAGP